MIRKIPSQYSEISPSKTGSQKKKTLFFRLCQAVLLIIILGKEYFNPSCSCFLRSIFHQDPDLWRHCEECGARELLPRILSRQHIWLLSAFIPGPVWCWSNYIIQTLLILIRGICRKKIRKKCGLLPNTPLTPPTPVWLKFG